MVETCYNKIMACHKALQNASCQQPFSYQLYFILATAK